MVDCDNLVYFDPLLDELYHETGAEEVEGIPGGGGVEAGSGEPLDGSFLVFSYPLVVDGYSFEGMSI